ncbi:radical SAM additional 4Fe4S-binding domain protein [Beggiatoa alba B18LD]|uniref:Radical SAM additional 4Fe4S-binding domain protein n=1 Tax=Beggiatoa alba B18LD TaxID=395493 RepID=I3CC89_9GAMM|nr:radical SAM/SPASM domain-containing protein [Beggiatoa alba]EIJ41232.1 radical SAM additional 4Fe4S-binding domain protein [Beggiatoa alba B18LD]
MEKSYNKNIHLLYSPTLACNLGCQYCYLGGQTSIAPIKKDAERAVSTLEYALKKCSEENILPFHISLHGGEVTLLADNILEDLFNLIKQHYVTNFDEINALGHKKSNPHIKTNLYRFANQFDLMKKHKVSISASIDLPLFMHGKYRTTKGGKDWLNLTIDNIKLLSQYPYSKKISSTISSEHIEHIDQMIQDIWFIHQELNFDMTNFNFMFAFESALNSIDKQDKVLTPASKEEQLFLYQKLKEAFTGTELEEGFKRNWFDEFKPSYCTNAFNCGEKFYLLQSNGSVYSCVRGQGIEEFYYGNIFESSVQEILDNGARKISEIHQKYGMNADCSGCNNLLTCNTGCAVVKFQRSSAKSYTCELQKEIYKDNPYSYPASPEEEQKAYSKYYTREMHPYLIEKQAIEPSLVFPNDLNENKNFLLNLIEEDEVLQKLYSNKSFILELNDEVLNLESQILKTDNDFYTLSSEDKIIIHFPVDLMTVNCDETVKNTLYLQMLNHNFVIYGDEKRSKQQHLFTYQIYSSMLKKSTVLGDDYFMFDLKELIYLHKELYEQDVLNNLFFTTSFLRDYHYNKQRNNAFYHIQAVNLPFQNFEFFYLNERED